MKYGMTLSKAAMILGELKVPSEMVNSVEIAEALRMGLIALEMQINLGQAISDMQGDVKNNDTYSASLVMDILNDGYMLSEVNEIDEQ